MSILTKDEILKEIRAGNIVIAPFRSDQIGPASIDLHLGSEFHMFRRTYQTVPVDEQASREKEVLERKIVREDDHFLPLPGETVLAVTKEKVKLPSRLCGQLGSRGRFARLGLSVHIASVFIQPGVDSHIFFLMTNVGPVALEIYPGIRICQLVIQETVGEAIYEGRFKDYKAGH
ncbi:dCTP deaminase [Candidatus Hakubella thermalkaliphila]|uniref:dCTP deaminase n=1 Tax=Candidatus Hakubella thermalkaliphila TaxID=2754717 RepID=A0A6V8PF62_9ACTN|nr:dCTP deaminase [Candidatus Hakubella thermalkaliphila]GFP30730.1 dCTP deaminase [Candidatus Hakubella thermalkaliphila]